jgi:hypothetical protein
LLPNHADTDRESCRFWTTTIAFIAATGPLGAVWAGDGSGGGSRCWMWQAFLGRTGTLKTLSPSRLFGPYRVEGSTTTTPSRR